ncbi:MAG: hypothetical protein JO022_13580, partial [Acidobacteriaceae bacterium]|nr:hypothetical protein [Acidobacteriaceae bacterium]
MGWFPAHVKRLDFIYFDAGGGHRSAALALKAVAEQQQRPWQVRLVNLQEVLDPLDVFRKVTGVRLQDLYNQLLKKGFTIGTGPLLRVMQLIVKVYHGSQVKLLSEFWRDSRPDMLVSLVPNFNRALFEGLRSADRAARAPDTPMVTILTDMADYPPHFWIEKQPQFLICGTSHAAEQAKG